MTLHPTLPTPFEHPPLTTHLKLAQIKERASKLSDATKSTKLPNYFYLLNDCADSPASLHLPSIMFPCQQHHNFNGNNTFPLVTQSIKCENLSCLEFLIKLKSQQISRSISANGMQNIGQLRSNFPVENKNKRVIAFPSCSNINETINYKSQGNVKKLNETDKKFESLSYSSSKTTTSLDLCNHHSMDNDSKSIFCNNCCENTTKTAEIDSELNASQTVRITICDNKQSLKFPLYKEQKRTKLFNYNYKQTNEERSTSLNQLSNKTSLNFQNLRNTITIDDFHSLNMFPNTKACITAKTTKFPLKTTKIDSKLKASQTVNKTNCDNKQSLKAIKSDRKLEASQTVKITNCDNKQNLKFPLYKKQERVTFLYYNYKEPKKGNTTTLNELKFNILSHQTNIYLQNLRNTNTTDDFNGLTQFPTIKTGISAKTTKFPLKTTVNDSKLEASQTVTETNCNNKQSFKFPLCKQLESDTFLEYNFKKPNEESVTTLDELTLNQLSHKTGIYPQNLRNTIKTDEFHRLTQFPIIKPGITAKTTKFPLKTTKIDSDHTSSQTVVKTNCKNKQSLKFHLETTKIDSDHIASQTVNETNCDYKQRLKYPLQVNNNLNKINYSTRMDLKFPFNQKQKHELFPCHTKKLNCRDEFYPICSLKNLQQDFQNIPSKNNNEPTINLPYEKKIYKNFPLYVENDDVNFKDSFFIKQTNSFKNIQQQRQQIPTHSLDGKTWKIINNSKTSLAQTTSRSMTHNLQKQNYEKSQKDDDNEHASQVHVESPATLAPAALAIANDDDLHILPAINSKNNYPETSQMLKYTKNIEHNNDAIIASNDDRACALLLFENIVNSFSTNHKNELEYYFGSADDGATTEFASTPPMSVTSVQNTKRTGSELTKLEVHHYIKHDLNDLCNSQVGHIVECSDVRDTLDKTVVDDGGANLKSRTGSFLVKQQLPTSPASLNSPIQKQSDSLVKCTSLENYNISEILPNYYVLEKLCESIRPEIDQIKTTVNNHNENKVKEDQEKQEEEDIKSQIFVTETRANVLKDQVHEMTITRLTDNDPEDQVDEELKAQLNEELENTKNIIIDDFKIDEMKFEMKSGKGALPSTASGRNRGKYDDTSSLTHTGLNRNRPLSLAADDISSLAHTVLNRPRPLSSAAATTRNYLSDTNNLPPLNSLRTDSNLPTNSVSTRVPLNDYRLANDSLISSLNSSRPSLNALRSTNSTSILSVDLPRYTPGTDSLGSLRPIVPAIDRATSIDTSLDNVLPERTRLRRQRRLRPQDSKDEPEDPIERLNLLKARISASLSEVKGVLKQYSTEENADENAPAATNNLKPLGSLKETTEEEKKDEGPVAFRFVKKIRRRSLFNEEEEEKKKLLEKTEENAKDETDKSSQDNKYLISNDLDSKIQEKYLKTLTKLPSSNHKDTENRANELQTETEAEAIPYISRKLATRDVTPFPNKSENKEEQPENVSPEKEMELNQEQNKNTLLEKIHKTPKVSETILEAEPLEKQELDRNLYTLNEEIPKSLDDPKGAIPKETKSLEVGQKTKKKLSGKNKEPSRRSSLAAVEASKIEPPVKVAIPAKIQRRPSDSEAIVKKKLITVKTTTSGSVEEVTPKPKILKVKRSLQKKSTDNNNEQLALTPTNNRDVLQKPTTTDDQHRNKSINIDENKDALMPNNAKTREQQFNGETNSQNTKLLMPNQLEIDENASLNEKSNENLVITQQLQQQQQQQDQQATNNSTTTNLLTNELPRSIGNRGSGAMLDNLTLEVSSPTTTEANGQLTVNKNRLREDLHDLLQENTAIVKITPTNNKTDLKVTQTEIKVDIENKNKLSELEARPTETANAEQINKQLEIKQQDQQQEQQQQVVQATHEIIVKKDEDINNKKPHEDDHRQSPLPLTSTEEPTVVVSATTKTISSPQISISTTLDITEKTTTEDPKQQENMPELKVTPAPVQTAAPDGQHLKKKVIIKKIIRQTSVEKAKKLEEITQKPEDKIEIPPEEDTTNELKPEDNAEENSETTELSEIHESSNSLPNDEGGEAAEADVPDLAAIIPVIKKERKIKKKVIIKRQKRRLSIGDTFFNHAEVEEPQISEIETLEKAVAYFSDDEADKQEEEAKKLAQDSEELKKPLKSCIMLKQYQIGDEVLYGERYKKTQVKWRRGRIKERITSISYMIDIEGKEISSHINYLKKYTGRKVNFGGKEYLEIDYEQLAEEEEKAEKLQRRSYSIWNMV